MVLPNVIGAVDAEFFIRIDSYQNGPRVGVNLIFEVSNLEVSVDPFLVQVRYSRHVRHPSLWVVGPRVSVRIHDSKQMLSANNENHYDLKAQNLTSPRCNS